MPLFLSGRCWRACSTVPSMPGEGFSVHSVSSYSVCTLPLSTVTFSSQLAWHTLLQERPTKAFSLTLLQVHGLLRKNNVLLVGTVPSLQFCIQVCWPCKTLVRLICVAEWNKQCSSGYGNLLLFFLPDVAVCLHVLSEKLAESLCWFLCLHT